MKNEGYYLLFFIFIGLLIFFFYYNQQQTQYQQPLQPSYIKAQPQASQHQAQPQQSIHQYHTQQSQQMNKKTNNTEDYTYNIENIDIHKDNLNLSNNENKLGCANSKYEPELEEVYGTTLRGNDYDTQSPDEIFNYSIKPNKSDLPIVNPPLQLLRSNAPLRLSERHLS